MSYSTSYSASPRPILKRTPSDQQHQARHPPQLLHEVHFPPSPSISRTFDAHPPSMYDRSPIVVSPNTCALPERGCPGRTYNVDEPPSPTYRKHVSMALNVRGGHVHPRAFQSTLSNHSYSSSSEYHAFSNPPPPSSLPPPLIPDLSSESEESDGVTSPPLHSTFLRRTSSPSSMRQGKYPYFTDNSPSLPIIPSSPTEIKVRRRRSSRERGERIRSNMQEVDDPGYEDDCEISRPSPPSPTNRTKKPRSRGRTSISSFSVQDDAGCLGGF